MILIAYNVFIILKKMNIEKNINNNNNLFFVNYRENKFLSFFLSFFLKARENFRNLRITIHKQ